MRRRLAAIALGCAVVVAAVVVAALVVIALTPIVVLGIAVAERWRLWRHGPVSSPVVPEAPASAAAWAARMERGRHVQAVEESSSDERHGW